MFFYDQTIKFITEPAIYVKRCVVWRSHTKKRKIISIVGDKKDPLSKGYICPKSLGFKRFV